eukprot:8378913-Karenia_brevis.AAC.1
MPEIPRLRTLACPLRGEILPASAGLGVEACMQPWGADEEARVAHATLVSAFDADMARNEVEENAQARSDMRDLQVTSSDPPQRPQALFALCCPNLGGPPDITPLQNRTMQWWQCT